MAWCSVKAQGQLYLYLIIIRRRRRRRRRRTSWGASILEQPHVCKQSSNLWLKQGLLYGETTGFIMAIQDNVIPVKNDRKFILKEDLQNDTCRRCEKVPETIEHITGSCTSLANMQYLHGHNNVTKMIHQQIAIDKKLLTTYTPYYKFTVTEVLENQRYKLYWDREVRTDIIVSANRPDILLYDKENKEVDLIDAAVPLSHNVQNVYAQKINKYAELATEIQQMWNVQKISIRPMVISATGNPPIC
jgi:hypothetical protein